MLPEDMDLLRRGYEAFNRGGVEAIIHRLSPEFQARDRESQPDRGSYLGRDRVRALFESNMEAFDEFRLEPEEFIEAGDAIVVVLMQRARGRASGAPVECRIAHVWNMRDGEPVELRIFGDPDRALAAARAEEYTG